MSDEHDDILDEDLSAWIDDELSEERKAELSALAERDPEVAARVDEFRALDQELSNLVDAPDREDSARLRASLAARLEREAATSAESEPRRVRGTAPPRPSRGRWSAGFSVAVGAVAAAALALFFALRPEGGPTAAPELPGSLAEQSFEDASSDELQMALELETLEDLEVIERLDVLERLAMLDDEESRG